MKKLIEVNNIASFEFWVNMFKVRDKKYQKDTLKRLKKEISIFESAEDNFNKIKALEFILNKN